MVEAELFWTSQTCSNIPSINKSLDLQLSFPNEICCSIPFLQAAETIFDLSCGDGHHVMVLDKIFNFKKIYISDINSNFVLDVHFNSSMKYNSQTCNLNEATPQGINMADVILLYNTVEYLTDNAIEALLTASEAATVLMGSKYSLDTDSRLESKYGGFYRTLDEMEDIANRTHKAIFESYGNLMVVK